jgi:hypothetical protein
MHIMAGTPHKFKQIQLVVFGIGAEDHEHNRLDYGQVGEPPTAALKPP